MKIVVAPDSFKGSVTALEAANAIEQGLRRVFPDAIIEKIPMADGGEGTVQSLVDATGGHTRTQRVCAPLGNEVDAEFGILSDGETAVIEMASASGLMLVPPDKRNPLRTTTYGTGQLICAALESGCRRLIIGIGGSATNDGGAGMAEALGVQFLNANGELIPHGGGGLGELASIDITGLHPAIAETETVVACDVNNPLTGPEGASHVYGPQKGGTPEMVKTLDAHLTHFDKVLTRTFGQSFNDIPGAGAAGGLGAGLMAFLNAELRLGVDIMIDTVKLKERMKGASLVFTGEGHLDFQTAFGKTPVGVAKVAKAGKIPVIAIAGGIGKGADAVYDAGIDAMLGIVQAPMSLEDAVTDAPQLIADTAEQAARLVAIGKRELFRRVAAKLKERWEGRKVRNANSPTSHSSK
ncbi:glycerate kinase [Candidatus Poribacteria bacterium]|nr:MAG: glycerate kinase [Candidatus Poribacteria bacterium]